MPSPAVTEVCFFAEQRLLYADENGNDAQSTIYSYYESCRELHCARFLSFAPPNHVNSCKAFRPFSNSTFNAGAGAKTDETSNCI